ncbi:MAG: 4Fe-4S dicluster domain-containing protein, partial [Deltaproteobacteria bacterium]|nr:4Fe-4S dicluster domain-containing protein [Deltaproteobacteria bacterium]
ALSMSYRGTLKKVGPPFDEPSDKCIGCGACVFVCPTDCIGLTQMVEKRRIERWGTEMDMARCKSCGTLFAPKQQLDAFRKLVNLPDNFYDYCPSCRPMG